MPLGDLRCYLEMIPTLQAEEALQAVAIAQAADSWADAGARQNILRQWQYQLPEQKREPISKAEYMGRLAMMGMRFDDGRSGDSSPRPLN
jgi:hypothetical protein